MPRNEDGEFELILGNRQLLSVFFIVVILLGVFFTMGYIVGRNTAPTTEVASTAKSEPTPLVNEPIQKSPEPATTAPEASAPVETTPQRPEPEATQEEKKEPTPAKITKSEQATDKQDKKDRSAKRSASSGQPQSGQSYLQLAATSKHEADIMVDVLRKKGFKSMTAEIEEKPGTFRVLVGPISEGGTNKMRADLQSAGFPGNAAIRRTF